ncbi:MFS transporter [Cellulomonas bogoriensis]|uniref:Membrane protein n=1 Tax=Cellulomonas bogoriensis 69B4 = DSM 16987 TaxID=1386082 RepID=A0A0A0C3G8_9CELL|nr:MFS transporter [Cellulomonas bogoriensis]KGM14582.1 membrane protein [Cellulomonas bogoriensis 69B4 = DSM 16987]
MTTSQARPGRTPEAVAARPAAVAVALTFALNGFTFASWASRMPAVRDGLVLSPREVGQLLLVGAVGSLVALPLSGVVVQRLGARRTVTFFALLTVTGLLVAGAGVTATTVWVVAGGLLLFGVGTGMWDAAMNLEGAAVEQQLRTSVMPRFHAGFSIGTLIGAGCGALAAWAGLPLPAHLGVALSITVVGVLLCVRRYLPEGAHNPAASAPGQPRRGALSAWGEPRTLLIGCVVLAAALTEGAANDWVALAVVDGFGTGDAAGALGFAVFVAAMTAMRFGGTVLLDRFGRVPVLRLSSSLALIGLLVFGMSPWLWLAVVGIVAWGAGAALGFPVGMSAASDDPARAAPRVAVVATVGYSAFLAGPPLLGLVAEHVGYRGALLVIAAPVVVGLLVVRAAAPLPTAVRSGDGPAPSLDP